MVLKKVRYSPRPVIIDTDMGVDDAVAIIMADKHPDIELKALTIVQGNVGLKQGLLNAQTVVKVLNGTHRIKVFGGCESSMVTDNDNIIPYIGHGKDGLGNCQKYYSDLLQDEDDVPIQNEHAVMALCRLAREYQGELEIIAIGPLTNLAMAYRLDPSFFSRLKSLYIMGGSQLAKGNMSRGAEFNFFGDPEAAHVVFKGVSKLGSRPSPLLTLATYECCLQNGIEWSFYYDVLVSEPQTKLSSFLKKVFTCFEAIMEHEKKMRESLAITYDTDGSVFAPCDMYSVMSCIEPDSVISYQDQHVEIELLGKHARGMMAIDWYLREPEAFVPNCRIILKMNTEKIQKVLHRTFKLSE